jgi:hypothetical protein
MKSAFVRALGLTLGLALAGQAEAVPLRADFNGDGLEDLAVGVPRKEVQGRKGAGAVSVFYGRPTGMLSVPHRQFDLTTPGLRGDARTDEEFGAAVAVGDFDGDGFDDLAVGTPKIAAEQGTVDILYGSAAGLHAGNALGKHELMTLFDLRASELSSARPQFGAALAAGDYDCDGYADLAIGAPGVEVQATNRTVNDAGAVVVFFGGPGGLNRSGTLRHDFFTQLMPEVPGRARDGNRFGAVLLGDDFDRDGCDDVVVGSPFERVDGKKETGAVTLLYGKPGGDLPDGSSYLVDAAPTGGIERFDHFGKVLEAGDFDGNGWLDLAVGHPDEDRVEDREGWVTVFFASSAGGGINNASRREFWHQSRSDVPGDPELLDLFGSALAAADFDGDGIDDLAMGVPWESFESFPSSTHLAGRVVVAYGTSRGLRTRGGGISDWDRDSVGVESPRGDGDQFGLGLGAGDFNHDGIADLIIGVPFEDMHMTDGAVSENAGMAQILYGTTHGLSALPELGRQSLHGGRDPSRPIHAFPGEEFGRIFAR